jgi:2-polyprenyl-6-methoxyphenol hydroxylase-like FAD-dependent oxidoreductase
MEDGSRETANRRVLISGGGIAGLTLGIFLRHQGWEPLIVERDPAVREEGYIVDLFGVGWDIADRVGILDTLREVDYPLDYLAYVGKTGRPFASVEMDRINRAFHGKYLPLRRTDLEKALFEKAQAEGISVRFATQMRAVNDTGSAVDVEFDDGSEGTFSLVFGADGLHSRTRQLVFGAEERFARFLGTSVAAFHTANRYGLKDTITLYEETDHLVAVYPISETVITTIYLFRHDSPAHVPAEERRALLQREFRNAGWICKTILDDLDPSKPIFLDSFTQIRLPSWSKGRITLLGDASGCLTMASGQGVHMAMGEAYVIARRLGRDRATVAQAFKEYEGLFKPLVRRKQNNAALLLKIIIPSAHTPEFLRRAAIKLVFGAPLVNLMPLYFRSKGVLANR